MHYMVYENEEDGKFWVHRSDGWLDECSGVYPTYEDAWVLLSHKFAEIKFYGPDKVYRKVTL